MKKCIAVFALTSLVATGMQAQSVAELEAKQIEVKSHLENYDDGIAKKFEIRLDGSFVNDLKGLGINQHSGNGIIKAEEGGLLNLGFGYNFNSNWYAGLASGYVHNMVNTVNQSIPFLADVAYRHNFRGEHWSIFGEARGGYAISVTVKKLIEKTGEMASFPNAFIGEIEAGAYYRITRNLDLKLALGYMHYNPSEKGGYWNTHNGNYFLFKVGFNFRMPVTKNANLKNLQAQYDDLKQQIAAARAAEEAELARIAAEKAAAEEAVREAVREVQKEDEINLVIFYDIRESEIIPVHYEELDKVGEWLKQNPDGMIIVKSYADKGTGNYNLNQNYSRLRMEKVKAELINKYGAKESNVSTQYFGDTEQVFGENNKNRCTLITLKKAN